MAVLSILRGELASAVRWVFEQKLQPISIVCQPSYKDDEIAQGNALSRALSLGLDMEIGGQGISWRYTSTLLETLLSQLDPITLAIFGAENAPEMARALASMDNLTVLLHCSEKSIAGLKADCIIELDAVTTKTKARTQTPKTLLLRLNHELAQKNWLNALSLMTQNLRSYLPEHLDAIGWGLMEQGLHKRLFDELSRLEDQYRRHPKVLRWRLAAAIDLWEHEKLMKEVEEVLKTHDDPELRAYFALALFHTYEHNLAQDNIARSLKQNQSAVGLWLAGQIYQASNIETSKNYLQQAIKRAEFEHLPFLRARIAVALSETAMQSWEPRSSQNWAEWAIRTLEDNQINHVPLRLQALNMLSSSRLYQGDTVGLEKQMEHEAYCLREANPRIRNAFEWTLAELLTYLGRTEEARVLMAELWHRLKQRESFAMYGQTYVQILLELGYLEDARKVAEQACWLNQGSYPTVQAKAQLAYLTWRSIQHPETVIDELRNLLDIFKTHNAGYEFLLCQLHLLRILLVCNEREEADQLIEQLEPIAKRFGKGLRAMVGPSQAFQEVFSHFEGEGEALELEFMGSAKAKFYGFPLSLRQRNADILAVLTLKPGGLSSEQLAMALYGEEGQAESARSEIKRAKKLVPIAHSPFQLEVGYKADFLEIRRLLNQGDLRGALNLYKGALLPQSKAPLIEEERAIFEETLRTAALHSNDPEALLTTAELIGEDLEVWEKAIQYLPQIDPRRAIAETRRRHIQNVWSLN